MSPKFDLSGSTGEAVKPEYFEHPDHGWLSYDPNTLHINPHRSGQRPLNVPIKLIGKFFGTKQPGVPTCSEPSDGNKGCQKWAGCPMKKFPHVGPGLVIMEKRGNVSMANCYDYYETTRGGRPTSQTHHGLDGWKLNVDRTTIDVLGRTGAVEKGLLNETSPREKVISSRPQVWQMEVGDLLPPWWTLMKKKGLPMPPSYEHYPELAEDDTEELSDSKSDGPSSQPIASPAGRKGRTKNRKAS